MEKVLISEPFSYEQTKKAVRDFGHYINAACFLIDAYCNNQGTKDAIKTLKEGWEDFLEPLSKHNEQDYNTYLNYEELPIDFLKKSFTWEVLEDLDYRVLKKEFTERLKELNLNKMNLNQSQIASGIFMYGTIFRVNYIRENRCRL